MQFSHFPLKAALNKHNYVLSSTQKDNALSRQPTRTMKTMQVQEKTFAYIVEVHQVLGVPRPGNLM